MTKDCRLPSINYVSVSSHRLLAVTRDELATHGLTGRHSSLLKHDKRRHDFRPLSALTPILRAFVLQCRVLERSCLQLLTI